MSDLFVINNFSFGKPTKTDRDEENLELFAPCYLNNFYSENAMFWDENGLNSKMDCLMFALPYVAEYFKVNKDKLLKNWIRDFGVHHMENLVANGEVEEVKYTHRFSNLIDVETNKVVEITHTYNSKEELNEHLSFLRKLSNRVSAFGKRFFEKSKK